MQKAEPQQAKVQNQSVAHQRAGLAVAPPQSEQISQLKAMMPSSPRQLAAQQFARDINNSPMMVAQCQRHDRMMGVGQRVAKSNQTGLPDQLKSGIENLSGMAMDHVKVHYNSSQPAQLNALAYAQGSDIHIAPGQEQHLPHEAWHLVQQAQGRVKPTAQLKGKVPVNDDQGLEREADLMGGEALSVGQRMVQRLEGRTDNKTVAVPIYSHAYAQGTEATLSSIRPIANPRNAVQRARVKKFTETEEQYRENLANYNEHRAKGLKAWAMLQDVLGNKESKDVNTKAEFVERYGVTQIADSKIPSPANSRIDDQSGFLSLDTGKKGESGAAYSNVVNPLTGVIVGGSNYAEKDPGPGRMSNSEILYHQYKMAMEVNEKEKGSVPGKLSNLNKILRNSIQGKKAIAVLDMCSMKMNERMEGKTFMPGDDDFFAILGTDNGKSAAFILKDHPNEIGWKTIQNITASNSWIEINIG